MLIEVEVVTVEFSMCKVFVSDPVSVDPLADELEDVKTTFELVERVLLVGLLEDAALDGSLEVVLEVALEVAVEVEEGGLGE